ncbi:cardiolipin synthase [Sphingomonas vulcanisoli]|uniref:Phospholipase D n=1 Tax=Sphingomonas vulcanisoli TaxID=1658060 RepID=A0ABX0TZL5_9SPHN|nr:phosphatidylserine/phosphatidylglycerophosphate/cardiolipin synthase family protein [Sphingomonas vulcanisoli]NIJ09071.1 cardiolipin synthase [Sphingomonas vulcanisoli]
MATEPQVNENGVAPASRPSFEVAGNHFTLLPDGSERLAALLRLIRGAKHSLRILYYIYCDDKVGRDVRAAMLEAIERGVDVRLIVDGFGSSVPADFFDCLSDKGADICRFIPRYGRRYFLRNHQKLALADEGIAIIGGFNIEDDYFDDTKGWRDLGLVVEGPAAKRITGYFDALARWTHHDIVSMRELRHALREWSEPPGTPVRWLFGGPMRRLSPWARTLKWDMEHTSDLSMIAAYFAPSPRMMRRIERIAQRGGSARLITPSKADHAVAVAAARHTFTRLLKRGVRVFEYQPRKLHTKLFLLDNVVHIGSANFDMRSMFLNLELMLRIEDKAFAAHIRAYFDGELVDSQEVTVQEHERAGFLTRTKWAIGYFIMAVLDASVTRRLNFGIDTGER